MSKFRVSGNIMKLESEHIYLRALHVNDAKGNYPSWLNDKEVCQYNSHGDTLYTKEMAISYIQSVQNSLTCKVFSCYNLLYPSMIKKDLDNVFKVFARMWKNKVEQLMDSFL